MNSIALDFPTQLEENDIPLSLSENLTIPPFIPMIENKTQEMHEVECKPKLKTEESHDENELPIMCNDFSYALNKYPGILDVNAIPGLLAQPDQSVMLNPNPFNSFKIPSNSAMQSSDNLLSPIDVRSILGSGSSVKKLPHDIRGPVDIRNISSNEYNDYLIRSESLFDIRGVGTLGGIKKEKSLAGLPAKLQELGVSKRLSKLDKLIRMDEDTMTKKQRSEKARLMRLEKNRRAAAVSRERKKRYIRSLEERSLIMSKHLEALELENSQLRKLLSQYNIQGPNILNDVLPSLPSLEPSPFDQSNSRVGKRNFTTMEKNSFSEQMNAAGGSREKQTLKMDNDSNKRATKRKRTSNDVSNDLAFWY